MLKKVKIWKKLLFFLKENCSEPKVKEYKKKLFSAGNKCYIVTKEKGKEILITRKNGLKGNFERIEIPENVKIKELCGRNASHSLLVTNSGKLFGRGHGSFGCLGSKNPLMKTKFKRIRFFVGLPVSNAYVGWNFSFVVLNGKRVLFGFGKNRHSELGIDTNRQNVITPKEINLDFLDRNAKIDQISCGNSHSLLLSTHGKVYSCGNRFLGQLGHCQNGKQFTLVKYFKKKKIFITKISAGSRHSLFLSKNNNVYGCGSNNLGQLGLKSKKKKFSHPKRIKSLKNISTIDACGESSFFLTKDNRVFVCGTTDFFQLGIVQDWDPFQVHKVIKIPSEVKVKNMNLKFVQICSFRKCTFFVTKTGSSYFCGKGKHSGFYRSLKLVEDLNIDLERVEEENPLSKAIYKEQRNNQLVNISIKVFG